MKDNKGLFAAIAGIAIVVIAGAVIMAGGKDDAKSSTSDMTGSGSTSQESSSAKDAPAADAVASNMVEIADYKFGPEAITVKVGTMVTWTNKDVVKHDVTPDKPSADFEASKLLGRDESYSFTFKKAGTYSYYCSPHPYMKATVVVTE